MIVVLQRLSSASRVLRWTGLALVLFTALGVSPFGSRSVVLADAGQQAQDGKPKIRSGGARRLPADVRAQVAAAIQRDGGEDSSLLASPYIKAKRLTTAFACGTAVCDDGEDGDEFGHSVAMSADGTTLVVGVPWKRTNGEYYGATYVFVKPADSLGGWNSTTPLYFRAKLMTGGLEFGLGYSVAVSRDGGTIVAGAPSGETSNGAGYVYLRPANGWGAVPVQTHTARLTRTTTNLRYGFGHSVTISGDGNTIVVGSPFEYSNTGTGYVFMKPPTGWVDAQPTWELGFPGAETGRSVSLSDDASTLVVGLPAAQGVIDQDDVYVGRAHVYLRQPTGEFGDMYVMAGTLFSTDGASFDLFGYSVSVNGDGSAIVVGAPGRSTDDGDGSGRVGGAYVFDRPAAGWGPWNAAFSETGKLSSSDGQLEDTFGTSVSFSKLGNAIVVGAAQWPLWSGSTAGPGKAYLFAKPATGWTTAVENAKMTTVTTDWQFGAATSVNADGTVVAVGAPVSYVGDVFWRGAAYVFTGSPFPSATTTSIAVSPNPVLVGKPVTVTFSVAGAPGSTAAPSGLVTVQASTGESCTGTAPTGSCALTFTSAANRTITATYQGDSNFAPSTSAAVTVRVVDFALSVSPSSQTATTKKATYLLTVTPVNGFSGAVSMSCAGGPPNSTCTVSPATVNVSGSASTPKATLTIPNGAAAGNYAVTFVATAGGVSRSVTATVRINR